MVAIAGCGGTTTDPTDARAPEPDAVSFVDAPTPLDAADPPADDAFVPEDRDAGSTPTDAPPSGGGAIAGRVTRTAMPAAGGRGHLYIAVFDRDPVTDRMGARAVARTRIENVDMSSPSASVSYRVEGIPPRAMPYYVTAFLDDNGTVDERDPERAGPDRGDLVALEGFSSPRVTVPDARTVMFDLVLNFNLPF